MDDMGYGDMSITGSLGYKTPNLDRLVYDGMLFTNFYSPASSSSASKAGFLSGCYPNRIGITADLVPNATIGLNPTEELIPEVLKKTNYKSCAIGTWHLGDATKFMPLQQGFDEFYGLLYPQNYWPYLGALRGVANPPVTTAFPALNLFEGNVVAQEIKTMDQMDQLTTQYTQRAITFINNNKTTPFFLYLAHSMPHVPLAVSTKFRGKSEKGTYGDVMMEVDWSVGEIVNALAAAGISNNTLIIFTSDNGPWMNYGNHAGMPGSMREGKYTTFEGGSRVPCIMKWPAVIPSGVVCNKLSSAIDILPTVAQVASAALPVLKIDGVSILNLLKGDFTIAPRKYFLYNDLKALRDNRFKLIVPQTYKTTEGLTQLNNGRAIVANDSIIANYQLYDLRRDAGERYELLYIDPVVSPKPNPIYATSGATLKTEMDKFVLELGPLGTGLRPCGTK
jgi:arylsulfatase